MIKENAGWIYTDRTIRIARGFGFSRKRQFMQGSLRIVFDSMVNDRPGTGRVKGLRGKVQSKSFSTSIRTRFG